ncbi:MAG: ParB/RepB/Spo0J family partition protein [Clostridia bacterium]|nr:ParB/RepB/Spo0J family partition protein [Clostridia bacterium]
MASKNGLGRGLDALFSAFGDEEEIKETKQPEQKEVVKEVIKEVIVEKQGDGVIELDIKKVDPNKDQPRKIFDAASLKELSESIKQHGVIQPIVVNQQGDRYMIIAGERRFRASLAAGLKTIPAVIKHYNDRQVKEVSIVENLQREDLNPIEAARAIKELMEEYNFTQETVADRIGKSRPAIANTLRLLSLTPEVISLIEKNKLSAGHARCLVVVDNPIKQAELANKASDGKMNVRDLEKLVKEYQNPKPVKPKTRVVQSLELKELVRDMERVFKTKVTILGNDKKGRIYLDYFSRDDLDRIAELVENLKNNEN